MTLKHNKKSALVQALPDLLRPATCGIPAKKVNIWSGHVVSHCLRKSYSRRI